MEGNAIPVSENTQIIIRTSADLYLSGGEQSEVRFFGSEERLRISREEEDTLRIENHSGLDLVVPHGARIHVERVGGSAFMQDLGMLEVQKVGGDLAMQRVDQVEIGKVGGSLTVRQVNGVFQVGKVGGDLTAHEMGEKILVESVGGSGSIQMPGGEECTLRVGGDLSIFFTRSVCTTTALRSGSSTSIYLPENVDSRFEVYSDAEEINLDLKKQSEPMNVTLDQRRYSFTLGEGQSRLELRAGSEIALSDSGKEPPSLSGEFDRLETSWNNARENRARYGWPGHFDPSRSAAWADMVSRRAQEAAHRAEQRVQAAMRRMEESSHRAEHEAFFGWNPGEPPPTPPVAPPVGRDSKVSQQERMMVLQMLQENKITVEQAEALLSALEGKF